MKFVNSVRDLGHDIIGLVAAIAASAAAVAAALPWNQVAGGSPEQDGAQAPAAVLPSPLQIHKIEAADAIAVNLRIPFSAEPNPPARPFQFRGDAVARARALECLATAIYYEASSESVEGQRAVAQVVLNRVRHPAFPKSICAVVYQGAARATGCQFTFTCDGSLYQRPNFEGWRTAQAVAEEALKGVAFAPVGYATHYHANYVVPYWVASLAKNRAVGAHIFYRWRGDWGRPAAFKQGYSGNEPDPCLIQSAALASRGAPPGPPDSGAPRPELTLSADPRVELISIVSLLAAGPAAAANETEYQRVVRARFSQFSEHAAVQFFRQLAGSGTAFTVSDAVGAALLHSPPPALRSNGTVEADIVKAFGGTARLEAFSAALRDFAIQARFADFFAEQQSFYQQMVLEAEAPATRAAESVHRYTGVGTADAQIIFTPLLKNTFAGGSEHRPRGSGKNWIIVGASGEAEGRPSDLLEKSLAYGMAMSNLRPLLLKNGHGADAEELLKAIAVRALATPTQAAAPERAEQARDVNRTIVSRLGTYERNRQRYASLEEFLPVLLAGSKVRADVLHRQMIMGMPKRCGAV